MYLEQKTMKSKRRTGSNEILDITNREAENADAPSSIVRPLIWTKVTLSMSVVKGVSSSKSDTSFRSTEYRNYHAGKILRSN
jgi:hypothetical protein